LKSLKLMVPPSSAGTENSCMEDVVFIEGVVCADGLLEHPGKKINNSQSKLRIPLLFFVSAEIGRAYVAVVVVKIHSKGGRCTCIHTGSPRCRNGKAVKIVHRIDAVEYRICILQGIHKGNKLWRGIRFINGMVEGDL